MFDPPTQEGLKKSAWQTSTNLGKSIPGWDWLTLRRSLTGGHGNLWTLSGFV
jgi:hypothetical protein